MDCDGIGGIPDRPMDSHGRDLRRRDCGCDAGSDGLIATIDRKTSVVVPDAKAKGKRGTKMVSWVSSTALTFTKRAESLKTRVSPDAQQSQRA